MRFPILYLLFLLTSFAAAAQVISSGSGLVFSRQRLSIETSVTLTAPEPNKEDGEGKKEKRNKPEDDANTETRRYFFDTEIRPENSLQQEWFHSLANMQEGRAMMIAFAEAATRDVPLAKMYRPVDVLVIGEDGTILAILPEITLASQPKQINVEMPVKAFMFLKNGEVARLQIKPKDMVRHTLFTPNPTVLQ